MHGQQNIEYIKKKKLLLLFPDTAVSSGLLYPRRSVITAGYKLNI